MGVKEPDTKGFMMFYETYNQFGFAFRIFSFGRSDQDVFLVLVIFTNTTATIVAAIEPACHTILKRMKLHVEKSTTRRQQLQVCVAGMSHSGSGG